MVPDGKDHDYNKDPRWAEVWEHVMSRGSGDDGTQKLAFKGVVVDKEGKVQFKNDDKLADEVVKHWTDIRDCLTSKRAEVDEATGELRVPEGERKPFEMDVLGIKMKISFEKTEDCLVGEPVNSSNEENPGGAAHFFAALDDYIMVIAIADMGPTVASYLLSDAARSFQSVWYGMEDCPVQ